MTPTRTDSVDVKHGEIPKVKKTVKFSKDGENGAVETPKKYAYVPKTPIKRKREEGVEETGPDPKKMDWIREKARASIIPDESAAVVKPEYFFKESGPLVFHLCTPCKQFNASRQMQVVDTGMVQIPLAMCSVCRGHLVQQRNLKFYQFELPNLKKAYYNPLE